MERPPSEDVPLFSTRSLEGEYTAWALVWNRDYGGAVNLDGVLVDNYGTCYITDIIAGNSRVRTYLGVETITAGYVYNIPRRAPQPEAYSMTFKYVLGENTGVFEQFDIWRDEVLIASIDLAIDEVDDSGYVAKSMSPNGKFLAFVINSIATGNNRYVMLYEGT